VKLYQGPFSVGFAIPVVSDVKVKEDICSAKGPASSALKLDYLRSTICASLSVVYRYRTLLDDAID
jgi:hypothetical protein